MTDAEKKAMLTVLTEESDDTILTTYLTLAGDKVLKRAYPFDSTVTDVPDKYAVIQVKIAQYLYLKRGAEGETAHSENGVARTYTDGDVPASLLRDILPLVAVVGGEDDAESTS